MGRVSHTWPSTVTEHLDHDDNGWEDCCRFFRLDPEKAKDPANPIKLPYINVNVFPYQLYGAWTLLEMETFQKGGYLADGMGLGKVSLPAALHETGTDQQYRLFSV